jgi:hypothetical protein
MPGDVVLLPTGTGHTLASESDAVIYECDSVAADKAREAGDLLRLGAGRVQPRIVGAA